MTSCCCTAAMRRSGRPQRRRGISHSWRRWSARARRSRSSTFIFLASTSVQDVGKMLPVRRNSPLRKESTPRRGRLMSGGTGRPLRKGSATQCVCARSASARCERHHSCRIRICGSQCSQCLRAITQRPSRCCSKHSSGRPSLQRHVRMITIRLVRRCRRWHSCSKTAGRSSGAGLPLTACRSKRHQKAGRRM